jgi:hypothetical protein
VEIASTSIFGGVSDSRKKRAKSVDADGDSETSGKRTLYVEAICVFGGVEIK